MVAQRRFNRLEKYLLLGLLVAFVVTFGCIATSLHKGSRFSSHSERIPTVWIVSHRRSGTHLTMDLIAKLIQPPFRLVKTNHIYLTDLQTKEGIRDGVNCKCLNYLRRTGKILHAHRDVRDVVISSYYYYQTFNPGFMKNVNKTEYFRNKNDVRNKVIGTWVNTTVPWFAQPDVLQLYFTDTISGFEHVYEKIINFLGAERRSEFKSGDKFKSISGVVAKNAGKGDHGYKVELPKSISDEILKIARSKHLEARENMIHCPTESSWLSRTLEQISESRGDGFWVGGKEEYGLHAPSYCPAALKTSKVFIDSGVQPSEATASAAPKVE